MQNIFLKLDKLKLVINDIPFFFYLFCDIKTGKEMMSLNYITEFSLRGHRAMFIMKSKPIRQSPWSSSGISLAKVLLYKGIIVSHFIYKHYRQFQDLYNFIRFYLLFSMNTFLCLSHFFVQLFILRFMMSSIGFIMSGVSGYHCFGMLFYIQVRSWLLMSWRHVRIVLIN